MKIYWILAVLVFLGQGCVATGNSVTYSTDGYTLKGKLCRPEGQGPFPVIIYNHGGLGTTIGGAPAETCTALAKDGYIGFSPIRRPTRSLAGHLDDVFAAVDYAKGLPFANSDRIAIMGFSRGAMLTYQAAGRMQNLKAVIIMATAMGRSGRGLDQVKAGSISAPVLVLVSKNDTGSHRTNGMNTVEGTKALVRALKKAGKEVEFIIYPPYGSDGHTLFFGVGEYWQDIRNFLKQHL